MIIIIAIVVIAIILIRIYYKGNKFWDKQPVSRSLKQSEGIITNIMPDILPSKKGQIVRYLGNQSYSDIGLFLSKNYIKGYIYDTAKINWSLSMPYMVERNRIAIYSHNRIISFISGKPFIVKLNNKELKLHYIDYLSVHKEHRNKNLAPIIISNIAKLCYTPEYTCYLFKKENNPLPFKYISKCKYFYYDLMRESPKVALDQKKYNFSKLSTDDNNIAHKYFIKSQDKYRLGFYPDITQFSYMFTNLYDITQTFCIKRGETIIGLCNIISHTVKLYEQSNRIAEITSIELDSQGDLTICDFMKLVMNICKGLGYRYINITNIAQNRIIIDRLGFTYTMDYYIHMYNYHIRQILQNCEIGYNFA